MIEIPGVDTINGNIVQKPPKTVNVGAMAMKALQQAQTIALRKWIAIIPYCVVCKEPLIWVRNSNLVFKCPKCGMRWEKDGNWNKDLKEMLVKHGK